MRKQSRCCCLYGKGRGTTGLEMLVEDTRVREVGIVPWVLGTVPPSPASPCPASGFSLLLLPASVLSSPRCKASSCFDKMFNCAVSASVALSSPLCISYRDRGGIRDRHEKMSQK